MSEGIVSNQDGGGQKLKIGAISHLCKNMIFQWTMLVHTMTEMDCLHI